MVMPDTGERVSRRKAIAATGLAGVGSLAGCLGFLIVENDEVEIVSDLTVGVGPDRADDFDPQLGHIEEGGSVTFEWRSGNHDVTSFHIENDVPDRAPEGTIPFSQDLQGPGEELAVDLDEEGIYDVLCVRHERVGMGMKLIVGWPDPDDQPGLAPPQEALSDAMQERLGELNEMALEILTE